jgi:hypothetical protein
MITSRSIRRTITLAPLLVAIAFGCNADNANRGAIGGHVTLDGRPVEQGSILFTPIDGTRGVATGGSIKDGQYRIAAAKGPAVGQNRIEIRAVRKTGRMIPKGLGGTGKTVEEQVEAVASRFNLQSTLKFEVKPGENAADFAVASK